MDQELEGGVWIPVVEVCRHERTGEFKLNRMGAREDSGLTYAVGNLTQVSAEAMARDGLRIILEGLDFYRVWPARTKLESEIGVMDSRQIKKFVRDHKFVSVLKRDRNSLNLSPSHRTGRGLRGVTAYLHEEIRLPLPVGQEEFFSILTKAFELAT
ncbi:MAG TPA: hypothetical protein VN673_13890 [Clostridia bacterium]|nr:hypothetical protein [Clostridia bacterium]